MRGAPTPELGLNSSILAQEGLTRRLQPPPLSSPSLLGLTRPVFTEATGEGGAGRGPGQSSSPPGPYNGPGGPCSPLAPPLPASVAQRPCALSGPQFPSLNSRIIIILQGGLSRGQRNESHSVVGIPRTDLVSPPCGSPKLRVRPMGGGPLAALCPL